MRHISLLARFSSRTILRFQKKNLLRACSKHCIRHNFFSIDTGNNSIDNKNIHKKTFKDVVQKLKQCEESKNFDDTNLLNELRTASDLVDVFFEKISIGESKFKIIENLNTILNFYDIFRKQEDFDYLASRMKSFRIANEATYFLVIRNRTSTGTWTMGVKEIKNMEKDGISLHARIYHNVIINAVENDDIDVAIKYFEEMKKFENVFDDKFYSAIIKVALEKKDKTDRFLMKLFEQLQDTGFTMGPRTFGAAKKWFERGICKCCGLQLKTFKLAEKQRKELQLQLQDVAEKGILKSKSNISCSSLPNFSSTFESEKAMKMNEFYHYLDVNGPFDIVLDVLNVAYYRDRGFNSFQVKRVIRHFNTQGKRILALCSSPLVSSLLEMEASPDLPSSHMITLLHYMRRQSCGLFFVDDKKEDGHIDDYFIILCMVYHNMKIDIITADKFGDHAHSLDDASKWHFKRWKRSHQIKLKKFTGTGLPVFTRRENYDIDVQKNETSWHFPGPNNQWLCCVKR